MIRILFLVILMVFANSSYAEKNKRSWDYPLDYYGYYEVKGSSDAIEFSWNKRNDFDVSNEFQNNEETGIISYLLYENGEIVIDEENLPTVVRGSRLIEGLLPSHSMGKSLVSYVLGHAICEGYIKDVEERLTGWDTIKNTLFDNQKLIDLLNMQAGDDYYVGERYKPRMDNMLKKFSNINVNTLPLKTIMDKYFQNTKKHTPFFKKTSDYNYSALTTNVLMNYVIHKTGDDWEKLLHKVFNEHVKVKGNVRFLKTTNKWSSDQELNLKETGRYSFYADRYDFLRIAITILNDWESDNCSGKYLKALYKQRIKKNDNTKEYDDVGLYTDSYGGQFHFDVFGLQKQKIIGLSGFAGQQILIDVDKRKIIVVNSLYRNYDWGKIVYEKIKQ